MVYSSKIAHRATKLNYKINIFYLNDTMQYGHWQRYKQEYYINISLHDFQPHQTLLSQIWKQILLARIGMKHAC